MAISSSYTGNSKVARGVTSSRLFLLAFFSTLTGSILGTAIALAMAGPTYWLEGSLVGSLLTVLISGLLHPSRQR